MQEFSIKGSDHGKFLIFVMIKCVFLTDLRSKTMTCYTFSVRPTIPESSNVKVAIKNLMKKKMKIGKIFAVDGLSFTKLKIDFRKIFVKASSSQNLQNSGF